MYRNVQSGFKVNGTCSDNFLAQIGSHQVSMLSPLLFIMVLEALSREICSGCQVELLYADDLALVREKHEGLKGKLKA